MSDDNQKPKTPPRVEPLKEQIRKSDKPAIIGSVTNDKSTINILLQTGIPPKPKR